MFLTFVLRNPCLLSDIYVVASFLTEELQTKVRTLGGGTLDSGPNCHAGPKHQPVECAWKFHLIRTAHVFMVFIAVSRNSRPVTALQAHNTDKQILRNIANSVLIAGMCLIEFEVIL